jgi:DNA-binding transcriptional LysR family regulator
MISISQIKTFVLAAEQASLANAARILQITPAAVSKQLILLEKELGLQLLNRTTRRVQLTEIGKCYLEQCKRILEEVNVATDLIEQMKVSPSGHLNIVSGRYFAMAYILPHLEEFLTKFPGITINLELAERLPNLEEEPIDLLIGMSVPATGNVIQRRIGSSRCCYCASPNYVKKFGIPKVPQELANHRHIIHSARMAPNTLVFPNKESVEITPYLRINDSQAMVDLAVKDLGIIKTQRCLVSKLLEEKKLTEILSSFVEPEFSWYVAFPYRRYIPSKTRCFIDFILERVEENDKTI